MRRRGRRDRRRGHRRDLMAPWHSGARPGFHSVWTWCSRFAARAPLYVAFRALLTRPCRRETVAARRVYDFPA